MSASELSLDGLLVTHHMFTTSRGVELHPNLLGAHLTLVHVCVFPKASLGHAKGVERGDKVARDV